MAIKSVSIRIEEEMLDKLGFIADYEGRSVNSHILVLIRENIQAFENEHAQLLDVMRLRDGGSAQHDSVNIAIGNGLFTELRVIHFSSQEDGYRDRGLYGLRQGNVIAVIHIIRRVGIIKTVVAAGVAV